MKIAIPIFDRVTALDAIGPYEVLSRLPGAELKFVGFEPGAVKTDNRMLSLNVETALEDFAEPDILVFPGIAPSTQLEWHDCYGVFKCARLIVSLATAPRCQREGEL